MPWSPRPNANVSSASFIVLGSAPPWRFRFTLPMRGARSPPSSSSSLRPPRVQKRSARPDLDRGRSSDRASPGLVRHRRRGSSSPCGWLAQAGCTIVPERLRAGAKCRPLNSMVVFAGSLRAKSLQDRGRDVRTRLSTWIETQPAETIPFGHRPAGGAKQRSNWAPSSWPRLFSDRFACVATPGAQRGGANCRPPSPVGNSNAWTWDGDDRVPAARTERVAWEEHQLIT